MFKPIFFILLIYWNLESLIAIAEPDNRLPPPITQNRPKPKVKEYIYTVPSNSPEKVTRKRYTLPPNPQKTVYKKTYTPYYRVEVPGDCSRLLMRVKKVESRAFIRRKEGFIQAGLFEKPSQAQQSVKKLAQVGLLARIVRVSR